MTTVSEWINQDARRRAPEFDFGSQWTAEHDPNTEWAVTYNTGTGELYARTRSGDDVEVLGQFADPQDVAAAVPDWGRRSMQAGSLDWIRRQPLAIGQSEPDVDGNPIYGVALFANGRAVALDHPQTIADVAGRISADANVVLDVACVNTGDRTDRVIMWVDDDNHRKNLPVNAAATQLSGNGWPILGNVVVVTDDKRPLPAALVRELVPDLDNPAPSLDQRPSTALDWEDHHLDRERPDSELGLPDDDDVDKDLEPGELDPIDADIQFDQDRDTASDIDHDRRAGFGPEPELDDVMMNPSDGNSASLRQYRSENFDELEATGIVNGIDAWVDQLDRNLTHDLRAGTEFTIDNGTDIDL